MPIYIHSEQHTTKFLTLTLTPGRGYGRAHAWRTRIMRISFE